MSDHPRPDADALFAATSAALPAWPHAGADMRTGVRMSKRFAVVPRGVAPRFGVVRSRRRATDEVV